MNDIRKAAILLLSLDEPLAGEVLSRLPEEMVQAVKVEMARLDDVPQEQRDAVVAEFERLAVGRTQIEQDSNEAANELLQHSLGEDGAGEIFDSERQSMSAAPFGFLKNAGADDLLTMIVDEHSQTIALVLSHLPASLGAEMLSGLSAHKQLEVIRRVAALEQTSPEVIRDVEAGLEQRIASTFDQRLDKPRSAPRVAEILSRTDRLTHKAILKDLEHDEPELVVEVRRLMFVFEDLLALDDEAVESLVGEVDNSQWALALKGATAGMKQKVLGHLSPQAADLLREEMQVLGPVRVNEVEAARQRIVDAARLLEDIGDVVVSSEAGAVDLIV